MADTGYTDSGRRMRMVMVEDVDALLRAEADQLLLGGLGQVLEDYGQMYVVGSYALKLMAWRDLDIEIVRPRQDRKRFFLLGKRMAELLNPPRMHYRDELVAKTEGLPGGLYWGVYLGDERTGAWKIDVWAVAPDHHQATKTHMNRLLDQLSPASQRIILEIKSAVWSHPEYRRKFSSQDIYQAVLRGGVSDIDAFWALLRQKGIAV